MSNEYTLKEFGFGAIVGVLFSIGVFAGIGFQFLNDSDRQLREYRSRVAELERVNTELGNRTTELIADANRRAEIDRKAIEQIKGIGDSIRGIAQQGQSIAVQLRVSIETLKTIAERARLLEELHHSLYNGSNN